VGTVLRIMSPSAVPALLGDGDNADASRLPGFFVTQFSLNNRAQKF
jgi:hypothetical protein